MPKAVVKKKRYSVRVNGELKQAFFGDPVEGRRWQRRMKGLDDQIRSGTAEVSFQPIRIDEWVKTFLEMRADKASYGDDEYRLRTYVLENPKFRGLELHKAGSAQWTHLFGKEGLLIKKYELSNASHNRFRSLVSKMYNDARKEPHKHCAQNPMENIKRLPEPKRRVDVLETDVEIGSYLELAHADEYQPAVGILSSLLLNLGIRQGNALGIQWRDIDWAGRKIWIRRKVRVKRSTGDGTVEGGCEGFVDGLKGHDGEEIVLGINDALMKDLKEWKLRAPHKTPETHVVHQPDGRPFTKTVAYKANRRIYRAMTKGLQKAKLIGEKEAVYHKPHALRHTYASQFMAKGGNIHELKEILNHSDLSVTQVYAKALKTRLLTRANVFQATRKASAVDANVMRKTWSRSAGSRNQKGT